jgi:sugar/nucleoside kinase (ribokinase family)
LSDLLVVGELNADIVVRDPDPHPQFGQVERVVESVELALGSSSAIFACGAARLGVPTTFVGVVGDDPLGRFVVAELRARGVDVSHCIVDTAHPTGASVILSAGDDRAVMTSLGTIPLLDVARVPADLVRDARHVHVGSYYLLDAAREGLPGLFRAARAGGASTSLDTNWDPSGRWDGGIWTLLADTDFFFPNEEEARR